MTKACYKCGSTIDISVKKRQRGIVTYMCRVCRQLGLKRLKEIEAFRESFAIPKEWGEAWEKMARESHQRVIAKYGVKMPIINSYEQQYPGSGKLYMGPSRPIFASRAKAKEAT